MEPFQFSKREKFFIANTLSCVPIILQGQSVLIDLLNECSVAGIIENADGFMNINLINVVYIDRNNLQHPFDEFMVKARMVRQIHIPGNINMERELRYWTEYGLCPKKYQKKKSGKRTFKQKRAEERHKEIVQKIAEQKTENLTVNLES